MKRFDIKTAIGLALGTLFCLPLSQAFSAGECFNLFMLFGSFFNQAVFGILCFYFGKEWYGL